MPFLTICFLVCHQFKSHILFLTIFLLCDMPQGFTYSGWMGGPPQFFVLLSNFLERPYGRRLEPKAILSAYNYCFCLLLMLSLPPVSPLSRFSHRKSFIYLI